MPKLHTKIGEDLLLQFGIFNGLNRFSLSILPCFAFCNTTPKNSNRHK